MANQRRMVLTAFLLTLLALVLCAAGIRSAFRMLGLAFVPTMLWLGVLETPKPAVSRRRLIVS